MNTRAGEPAGPRILADLANLRVADVLVQLPQTLPHGTLVHEARDALRDDHVHMLLLTDRGLLRGTLIRGDVPDHAGDMASALPYAEVEGRTVGIDRNAEEARLLMIRRGQRRLVVVDHQGALVGLLCLQRKLSGFCTDSDIMTRATVRRQGV